MTVYKGDSVKEVFTLGELYDYKRKGYSTYKVEETCVIVEDYEVNEDVEVKTVKRKTKK
jgi:hypothetical protein